jgi:hypothetical protein
MSSLVNEEALHFYVMCHNCLPIIDPERYMKFTEDPTHGAFQDMVKDILHLSPQDGLLYSTATSILIRRWKECLTEEEEEEGE